MRRVNTALPSVKRTAFLTLLVSCPHLPAIQTVWLLCSGLSVQEDVHRASREKDGQGGWAILSSQVTRTPCRLEVPTTLEQTNKQTD